MGQPLAKGTSGMTQKCMGLAPFTPSQTGLHSLCVALGPRMDDGRMVGMTRRTNTWVREEGQGFEEEGGSIWYHRQGACRFQMQVGKAGVNVGTWGWHLMLLAAMIRH